MGERYILVSSPRERGCFQPHHLVTAVVRVFPARAGVFLMPRPATRRLFCLPRASGGVSIFRHHGRGGSASSPRERGCFPALVQWSANCAVFPARAGVFPCGASVACVAMRLPRASGGVSCCYRRRYIRSQSSPRERGCFLRGIANATDRGVFPARAGVFPTTILGGVTSLRLPRASGGVSNR